MSTFKQALDECGLYDLGFIGPRYTWCNGRSGENHTRERLDRAMATRRWCTLFDGVQVTVLTRYVSDHHPLLVEFSNSKDLQWTKNQRFRYEASWTKSREHREVVKKMWKAKPSVRDPWKKVFNNLTGCRRSLKQWVRKQAHPIDEQIQKKEEELRSLQLIDLPDLPTLEAPITNALQDLLEQEDLKWKQRAKENWLQFGDRNSKFFHACANQKHSRSKIQNIDDINGRNCSTKETIEEAFVGYFSDLFKAGENLEVEACVDALDQKVTPEMNRRLLAEFTVEEIAIALNQMPPLKSPGPDGFSACFYQHNWGTVHSEVCAAILIFLNSGNMDARINYTHIALIPKVASPSSVTEFRPISLCNVIYKLLSKVLANRLKTVLPEVISCYQSAFLQGRLITDNFIAAYETLHSMQSRMWSKMGFMGIKLDMSKAYDRVEWDFLEAAMGKLGFVDRWINLVMTCVRTVTYKVIVNGNPVGLIKPSRGIRQGDSISSYLFILCAEALSNLLIKAEKRCVIIGVPTSPRGPRLSHLFFADDSLLFCKANSVEWRRLLRILGIYEAGSGQKLNLNKTSIFFSRNTSVERRQEILQQSGLQETQRLDTYLGLPSFVGKSRKQAFCNILGRVSKKLGNWKVKFLSQAGKEVLLKAVVQAIPTYSMGVFQLPVSLCKEINKLMQEFWWQHIYVTRI